jgi:P27 family predicted phage terminase small subunit
MGKRGPKPKATALKILHGDRADRVNRSAPAAPRSIPARPGHFDEFAREAWDRLIPQLDGLGLLTAVDAPALELYCAAYSRWRRALTEIEAFGVTSYTTEGASVKANPACNIAAQAERLMAALLTEFGLTPSSRSRVKSAGSESDDALAAFLARRKA